MRLVDSILFADRLVAAEKEIPALQGFDPQVRIFDPAKTRCWLRTQWAGDDVGSLLVYTKLFAREIKSSFALASSQMSGNEFDFYDEDFPLHPGETLRVRGLDNNGAVFKNLWLEYDDMPGVKTRYITYAQYQRYEKRPYSQFFDATSTKTTTRLGWISLANLLIAGGGNVQTWEDESYYALVDIYHGFNDSQQSGVIFLQGNFSGPGVYSIQPGREYLVNRPIMQYAMRTGTNIIPVIRGSEFRDTQIAFFSMENADTDVRHTFVARELKGFKE